MKKAFTAGTVFLRDTVRLPPGMEIETRPCAPGWKVLANMDGYAFDRAIREAGWNFCSLANPVRITVVGSQRSSRLERGIRKIAARLGGGEFNAFEIAEVSAKSFLGVPYAHISVRSRHVQESMFLAAPDRAVPAMGSGYRTEPRSGLAIVQPSGMSASAR
jgi:hypothetical protein